MSIADGAAGFAAMRALLGKRVRVTLDHDDPDAYLIGTLRELTEEGECVVVGDDLVAAYAWPTLRVEAWEGPTPKGGSRR